MIHVGLVSFVLGLLLIGLDPVPLDKFNVIGNVGTCSFVLGLFLMYLSYLI